MTNIERPVRPGGEQDRARRRLEAAEDQRERLSQEQAAAAGSSERLRADVDALGAENEVGARARWLEWAAAEEELRSGEVGPERSAAAGAGRGGQPGTGSRAPGDAD